MSEKAVEYQCSECKYSFTALLSLKRHKKAVHEKIRSFECQKCDYKASKKDHLLRHIKSIHNKIKDHECPQCEYKAACETNIKQHVKSVHFKVKDFSCPKCNYTASRKSHINSHVREIHDRRKFFSCEHCEYQASRMYLLKIHLKAKHNKIRDHACDHCDFKASTISLVKRHVKAVHDKVKAFACDQCEYKSAQKVNLQDHVKSKHNQNRNYACTSCEYKAKTESRLKSHIKEKHLKIKDFDCGACGYKTTRSNVLKNHIKSIHGITDTGKEKKDIKHKGKYVQHHNLTGTTDNYIEEQSEATNVEETKFVSKVFTNKITWPKYEAHIQHKKQEQFKVRDTQQKVEDATYLKCKDQNMSCTDDVVSQETKLLKEVNIMRVKNNGTLEGQTKKVIENVMMEEISRQRNEQDDLYKDTDITRRETETEESHGKEKKAIIKMKKFKCKYCCYQSSIRHGLRQHLKFSHKKASYFECSLCDYWTNLRFDLRKHKKLKHKSLKSCNYCDYDAISEEMLIEHIMTNVMTHVASNNID